MMSVDIAIVGGGLVGASLALALAPGIQKKGWKVCLIESFEPGNAYQPSYDARASALSYGTRKSYEALGLWQAIAPQAEPIRQIHVSEQGHFANTRLSAAEEGVAALGYVVENQWLGKNLWHALQQTEVQCNCPAQVLRLQANPEGYLLEMDGGRLLQAKLVVLADGGRSGLREQLGIAVESQGYGQSAVVTNVTPSRPHAGQAFERFTSSGPLALLPLPENRCALVWTQPSAAASALVNAEAADFLRALQAAFGFRLGAFVKVGQRHSYPLALSLATEQFRSGLVVLGNAAHSLHPIAGQGYNLSLRDALILAEVLLHAPGSPGALATLQHYYQRQHQDQWLTIGFSDALVKLFAQPNPCLAASRRLGLAALDWVPTAKHHFARQAMGLGPRHSIYSATFA